MIRSLTKRGLALLVVAATLTGCGVGGILAASSGGGGGGGSDSRRPAPPRVTVTAPATDRAIGNFIAFQYKLADPRVKRGDEGRPGGPEDPRVRVFVEFQIGALDDRGRFQASSDWLPMTEVQVLDSDGTRALSLGDHTFVWNTLLDIGDFVGRAQIRVRAEYEPTAGFSRKFRGKPVHFPVDNRLADTVAGVGVVERTDIDTFPVDIISSGADLFVASAGAGIVERINALGVIRRAVGLGLPGNSGDGGDPGVARLDTLRSVDVLGNGLIFTNNDDRIRVTNPTLAPIQVGSVSLPARTILTAIGGLVGARGVRAHPTGAILYINNRTQLLAFNPQDPSSMGSGNITIAGVQIAPGTEGLIAGGGTSDADGTPAQQLILEDATSLEVGPDAEIYFGEQSLGRVRVINAGSTPLALPIGTVAPGTVMTVAGQKNSLGFSGDGGPAVDAQLNRQDSIAVDAQRRMIIGDLFNRRVRVVNLSPADITFAGTTVAPGNIDTVVGSGEETAAVNVGALARDLNLASPNAVAIGVNNTILIADGRQVIMVNGNDTTITAYGQTALGGRTRVVYEAERRAGLPLFGPIAMHARTNDEVFFTDQSTVRVFNQLQVPRVFGGASVEPGSIAVLAGGAVPGSSGDGGPARSAAFNEPAALATDGPFKLFVADTGNHRVRFVNVGDPLLDGVQTAFGVTVGPGAVNTVVGNGSPVGLPDDGDGLAPVDASLSSPQGLAIFGGLLFVADTGHDRVRCVNPGPGDATVAGVVIPENTIGTIYGDGSPGFTADGPGPWQTDQPLALVVDSQGILYIAEGGNARIRALNLGLTAAAQAGVTLAGIDIPANEVRTLVGTGVRGNFGNGGGGVEATIDTPRGLLIQSLDDGTPAALYFSDTPQQVVRVLNLLAEDIFIGRDDLGNVSRTVPGGGIDAIAGGPNQIQTPNAPAFAGDGQLAEDVRFFDPIGIAITSRFGRFAHFFVGDNGNNRVRRFGAPRLTAE